MAQIEIRLKELNAIALEFGLVFEPDYPGKYIYPWAVFAPGDCRLRFVLADLCEESGSRWAEVIRFETKPEELDSIYIDMLYISFDRHQYVVSDCKRRPPNWTFQDRRK